MTKHKPATPLPWQAGYTYYQAPVLGHEGKIRVAVCDSSEKSRLADSAYIAHAANAYPRLVEALRAVCGAYKPQREAFGEARALLRELGEDQ